MIITITTMSAAVTVMTMAAVAMVATAISQNTQ
jgi:hypothetical protein